MSEVLPEGPKMEEKPPSNTYYCNGLDKNNDSWQQQKLRMDRMIDSLKRELKEVQTMDKNLTKQFIVLGGQINKLKTASTYYDDGDDNFAEGDENNLPEIEDQDEYDTKF